jgi:predicted nuclease of predicted toxin-antitoxin system
MSLKFLIDMNLSPAWAPRLQRDGWSATHWSAVGDPRASDREILAWAATYGFVVFTHDLDFGTVLANTHAHGPSVLQVRSDDVLPDAIGDLVAAAIRQHKAELISGALVVVDKTRNRVRVLPI